MLFRSVKRGFNKCGADIISNEFPELQDIGGFEVDVIDTAKVSAEESDEDDKVYNPYNTNYLPGMKWFDRR